MFSLFALDFEVKTKKVLIVQLKGYNPILEKEIPLARTVNLTSASNTSQEALLNISHLFFRTPQKSNT